MKPSIFNVYRARDGHTAIFNTLTGGSRRFTREAAAQVERGVVKGLSPAEVRLAASAGILVPDQTDERQRYRDLYLRMSGDRLNLSLVVSMTYRCNLRCPYCFESGARSDAGIAGESARRLLAAIRRKCEDEAAQSLSLMLFGGEPLLVADECLLLLGELSSFCASRGMAFTGSMSSNGTLWTPELVERFAPYLKVAQLTLDGPRETHDGIRTSGTGQGTYDRVIRAVHLLRAGGIAVQIRVQACEETKSRLPELIRDLKREGFLDDPGVRCDVAALRRFSRWRCSATSSPVELGAAVEGELLGTAPELLLRPTPATQILPCVTSGNMLCVAPDLRLYKCITQLGQLEFAVGEVAAAGTFALNEAHADFMARNPLDFAECRDCAYLPLCGGGCPVAAYHGTGSWRQPACYHKAALQARIDNALGGV